MPEIITYSLKTNQKDSDEYYSIISDLCDEVFKHVTAELKDLLTSFKAWDDSNDNPHRSSIEEDIYSLLSLGILWQQYAAPAKASRRFNRRILTRLVNLRRKNTVLKPIADLFRGILTGLTSYNKNKEVIQPDPTLQNLDLLLDWLQASGEYDEIVSNLRKWSDSFLPNQYQKLNQTF